MRWRLLLLVLLLLAILGQPLLTPGRGSGRLILGQDYRVASGQRIAGDLIALGGDLTLEPDSSVRGDVLALGGEIEVLGRIEGRAVATGGAIRLHPAATVTGDVVAAGEVQRDPPAVVGGKVRAGAGATLLPALWFGWPWGLGASVNVLVWLVQAFLGGLLSVAVGLLAAFVFPAPLRTAAAAVAKHPLQCLGAGLFSVLAAVLAVLLLAVTLLGIPLALLIALALLAVGLYGWVAAALALGERLLLAGKQWRREPTLAAAVGMAALSLLLSVPCLAIPVALVAGVWGVGAVLLTRLGTVPFSGAPPQVMPDKTGLP